MQIKSLQFGLLIGAVIGSAVLVGEYGPASPSTIVFAETSSGLPVRLIIPRIHVDATIEGVDKEAVGLFAPPKLPLQTGWWKQGPLPGDEGTAVITGYVHWKYGATAMFGDLHFLKSGDRFLVGNDRGVVIPFIIREIKTYDLDADVAEVFGSPDGKSHLNLVTYDGVWDKPSKSYSKRLAIFADKEIATTTAPQ